MVALYWAQAVPTKILNRDLEVTFFDGSRALRWVSSKMSTAENRGVEILLDTLLGQTYLTT